MSILLQTCNVENESQLLNMLQQMHCFLYFFPCLLARAILRPLRSASSFIVMACCDKEKHTVSFVLSSWMHVF